MLSCAATAYAVLIARRARHLTRLDDVLEETLEVRAGTLLTGGSGFASGCGEGIFTVCDKRKARSARASQRWRRDG